MCVFVRCCEIQNRQKKAVAGVIYMYMRVNICASLYLVGKLNLANRLFTLSVNFSSLVCCGNTVWTLKKSAYRRKGRKKANKCTLTLCKNKTKKECDIGPSESLSTHINDPAVISSVAHACAHAFLPMRVVPDNKPRFPSIKEMHPQS